MGNATVGVSATPERTVTLTEDYYAGVFEPTQLQWLQVMCHLTQQVYRIITIVEQTLIQCIL